MIKLNILFFLFYLNLTSILIECYLCAFKLLTLLLLNNNNVNGVLQMIISRIIICIFIKIFREHFFQLITYLTDEPTK